MSNNFYNPGTTSTHISSIDSMSVFLHGGSGCSMVVYNVTINNTPVNWINLLSQSGPDKTIKVLAHPGAYEIKGMLYNTPISFHFTLILDLVENTK